VSLLRKTGASIPYQENMMGQTGIKRTYSADEQLTVGLLGASFGTNNLGVAALACGTVASICHSSPDACTFLVDYAKEPAAYQVVHPGGVSRVELINVRFSKRFYLRNNIARLLVTAFVLRLLPLRRWRMWILEQNQVLKAIRDADVIGSISGGDSFSDIYGIERLIYVALPQILVILLGKPLILLPQTIGPFKGTIAKRIARFILNRARTIYCRDYDSSKVVRKILRGDHNGLGFCYDMGFALEPHIRDDRVPAWLGSRENGVPLVGINISGLLYIGGYTQDNMFGIKADYRHLIHELITLFVRDHNARVMLVPHVLGAGENSESDMVACRKVYNESGDGLRPNLHLVEEGYDQHELKALIGRCDFFIGSRMHACIAALSQCVPAVGLAYSTKFLGVFESIGMEELVIDLRKHDRNAILTEVGRTYLRRPELQEQLKARMPAVRASVLNLFNPLRAEAGGKI
jgi:colanic acid/amylovoran biosynthesis protein